MVKEMCKKMDCNKEGFKELQNRIREKWCNIEEKQ